MTRATANAYALLGLAIVTFWLAVFGVPAARSIVEQGVALPPACAGLTADECTARAAEGW